jgi:hypothetical protein
MRRRAKWTKLVSEWRASGLSAREFAAREGLNRGTLYRWSAVLSRAAAPTAAFVEVAPALATIEEGRIEVVVRDQVRIRVSGAFDAGLLRRVVEALEAR